MPQDLGDLVIGKGRELVHISESPPFFTIKGAIQVSGKYLCPLVKEGFKRAIGCYITERL